MHVKTFRKPVKECFQGKLVAPFLINIFKMAFPVYSKHRLDIKDTADGSTGSCDTAALLQVLRLIPFRPF